jgi:hypothetical protein
MFAQLPNNIKVIKSKGFEGTGQLQVIFPIPGSLPQVGTIS